MLAVPGDGDDGQLALQRLRDGGARAWARRASGVLRISSASACTTASLCQPIAPSRRPLAEKSPASVPAGSGTLA